MLRVLSRNWWLIVVRGACAIMFGLLAWSSPAITLATLVLVWGAFAMADGVIAVASALTGASDKPWWVLALDGVVAIGAALVAMFYPGVTALVLLYVIALRAIAGGVLQIVAAIQLRKEIEGELWLALAGTASLAFGLFVIARPGAGALAVLWTIGLYAVVFGIVLVGLGFRVRGFKRFAHAA
jgi:uncharacterized membrane protein HdeD (DUF308 family)